MKKKVIVALLCALCLSFVGCDKDYVKHNSDETSTEKEESRDTTESEKKTETKKVDTEEKEDNSKDVIKKINEGTKVFNEAVAYSSRVDNAQSLDDMYDIFVEAAKKYNEAANIYKKAADLCGSDSNLSSLKSSLNAMVSNCPSKPSSSSQSDLSDFVYEEMDFNLSAAQVEKEAEKVASDAGVSLSDIKTEN